MPNEDSVTENGAAPRAPKQRRDPAVKAADALRVAENRLEKLATARLGLQNQIDEVDYRMAATRQHVNYLASHPLLQVEVLQANLGTNSSEQG